MHTADEAIERAIKAYFRRYGERAPQPNIHRSHVEGRGMKGERTVVVLENVRGELARYRATPSGLRFVPPEVS
jgi:hypothetical protein